MHSKVNINYKVLDTRCPLQAGIGDYFIGKVGDGPRGGLYVRTFHGYILVKDPTIHLVHWVPSGCLHVEVYQIVSLHIELEAT